MTFEYANQGVLPFVGDPTPFTNGGSFSGSPILYTYDLDLTELPATSILRIWLRVRSADGGIKTVADEYVTGPYAGPPWAPHILSIGPILSCDGGYFASAQQAQGTDTFDVPFHIGELFT